MPQPRVPELLAGIASLGLATFGVLADQMMVFGGYPGDGTWTEFGEHPWIFLIYLSVYIILGVYFIWEAFEEDHDNGRDW